MSVLKEFKEFAMRGNVVDMAVGIIIGAAFGKIVSSFVNDILMPPLGILIGRVDFKQFKLTLIDDPNPEKIVYWNYGQFVNNIVDFVIVAFSIFLMVKVINALDRKHALEPAAAKPTNQEMLLGEIRDLLKEKR